MIPEEEIGSTSGFLAVPFQNYIPLTICNQLSHPSDLIGLTQMHLCTVG